MEKCDAVKRNGDLKILNLESCKLYVYIYSRDRQKSYLNRGKEARRLLIVFGSRPLEYEIAIEIAGSRVDYKEREREVDVEWTSLGDLIHQPRIQVPFD